MEIVESEFVDGLEKGRVSDRLDLGSCLVQILSIDGETAVMIQTSEGRYCRLTVG